MLNLYAVLAALLFATQASSQSLTGSVLTGVSLSSGGGGGGGGIAGVEAACTDSGLYGSGGNCVCSETLDASFSNVANNTSYDFPGSPDTHECWGNRYSTYTTAFASSVGQYSIDVSASDGWGDANYAMYPTDGNTWARIPFEALGTNMRTMCLRFYRQYSTPWETNGSCRTKTMQFGYGSDAQVQQPRLRDDGGSCTTGRHEECISNPSWLCTGKAAEDCDGKPCRYELCIDGPVKNGGDIEFRYRVTSFEGGTPSSGTAQSGTIASGGGVFGQETWGGDWWFNGNNAGMTHGYYSVFAWDSDTDQWPGGACEVEGGC